MFSIFCAWLIFGVSGGEIKKELNLINGLQLELGDNERFKDGCSAMSTFSGALQSHFKRLDLAQ